MRWGFGFDKRFMGVRSISVTPLNCCKPIYWGTLNVTLINANWRLSMAYQRENSLRSPILFYRLIIHVWTYTFILKLTFVIISSKWLKQINKYFSGNTDISEISLQISKVKLSYFFKIVFSTNFNWKNNNFAEAYRVKCAIRWNTRYKVYVYHVAYSSHNRLCSSTHPRKCSCSKWRECICARYNSWSNRKWRYPFPATVTFNPMTQGKSRIRFSSPSSRLARWRNEKFCRV